MRERDIEKYLRELVEAYGGICEKFVSPGRRGVPDRLITWPDGVMRLAETKTQSGRLSSAQLRDHDRRACRGVTVAVIWSKTEAYNFVMKDTPYARKTLKRN